MELATAPRIRFFAFASSSMKKFVVEPVPTPRYASSTTCFSASRATSCFCSSWVMIFARPLFLPHRRQVGANTFEDFGRKTDRFGKSRVRMYRLSDVHCIGAHLDRQRDFADEVA